MTRGNQVCNIIVQTSGDTGPAAAHAIVNNCSKKRCKICVLYPYKQASRVQSRQLTTLMYKNPDNVKIYASDRTMDEQRLVVKKIFNDTEFVSKYKICAMNSINFVRILGMFFCLLFTILYCYSNLDISYNDRTNVLLYMGLFTN